ncbi:MAG TPA: outer membrane protein assembly factor BamC [Gammaproteobacteria bacterium]|nr:outer membrane protein assembly factor BamC [Gammaproteobacteria bacterium]
MMRVTQALAAAWLAVALGGCSIVDNRPTYEQSDQTHPLEVPPDLTAPPNDSRMDIPLLHHQRLGAAGAYSSRQANVTDGLAASKDALAQQILPTYANIQVRQEGGVRWLEVNADPAVLWPKLRAFWRQAGINLERNNPQLGIMQTDWIEPSGDALSDDDLRDSYRLRLERQDTDTTNVYISHRGVAQFDANGVARWEPRPSDPGLEAEYLTRLMVYLGESRQHAEQQLASANNNGTAMRLDQVAGIPVLVVKGHFGHVWQLTGVALDRAGLPVEEEDVTNGTYYFSYQPAFSEDKGVLTALPGGHGGAKLDKDRRYQVQLLDQPGQTLITAQAAARKPLPPAAAEEILGRLIASMQGRVETDARVGTLTRATPDGA